MKRSVVRFAPHQTAKVVAVLYLLMTLIFVPFGVIGLVGGKQPSAVAVVLLLAPILYGVLGYVFTAIGCWLYNFVASKVGGIQVTIEEVQ